MNKIRFYTIQYSICRVHNLLISFEFQFFAFIHLTHQHFNTKNKMKHFNSTMMKSIYMNHHRFFL